MLSPEAREVLDRLAGREIIPVTPAKLEDFPRIKAAIEKENGQRHKGTYVWGFRYLRR